MKKIWDKAWEIAPYVWGALWLIIITFGSIALAMWLIKLVILGVGALV